MRFALEILTIGLLFNSGFAIPAPVPDDDYPSDDAPKPKGNPVITTQPQEIVPQIGQDLVLPCNVESNVGEDSITWTYNGNSTLYIDSLAIVASPTKVDSNHSLHIEKFSTDSYGNYTCAVPQFNLAIVHKIFPRESVAVESISAKKFIENLSELSLTCRTKGFPTPAISWSRKNSENSVETDLNSKSATYVIPKATFIDSGIYSCKADNGDSADVKSVAITVINGVAPESAKVHPGEAESSTKLCCVFDFPRVIIWQKNGKVLPIGERFYVETEKHKSCLVIKKAKEEDLGTFTCQTEKNAQEHADIELNGSPAKPVVKLISADDSKNPSLTWTVSNLLPISEYAVFVRRAEETEWTEVGRKQLTADDKKDEVSYIFSNLRNGRYSVKLEVSNKYGSNESIENGALAIDRIDPNDVMAEKINSGNGAERHFRISSLCVLFAILMRLWSC